MEKIILNDDEIALLGGFQQPLEVLNPQGRVVGTLSPSTQETRFCPFTDAELREASTQDKSKGITTEELKAYLRGL